jgi:hypothetical protein
LNRAIATTIAQWIEHRLILRESCRKAQIQMTSRFRELQNSRLHPCLADG